jgi:hypothetical protein
LRALQRHGVSFFFPSDVPPGCPKGISSDHHSLLETWFLETRKGVPTNWAGTPDLHHLELPTAFAKSLFTRIPVKKGDKSRFSGRRRW